MHPGHEGFPKEREFIVLVNAGRSQSISFNSGELIFKYSVASYNPLNVRFVYSDYCMAISAHEPRAECERNFHCVQVRLCTGEVVYR